MFVDVLQCEYVQNLVSKINIAQIHVNFYVIKKKHTITTNKPINVIDVRKIEFRCMVVKGELTKGRKHSKTFHVAKECSVCLAVLLFYMSKVRNKVCFYT